MVVFLFFVLISNWQFQNGQCYSNPNELLRGGGNCLSDITSELSPPLFSASRSLNPETEQYLPYHAKMKSPIEASASAWCRSEPPPGERRDWLQIDFPTLHLIGGYFIKGRQSGKGDTTLEYVSQFALTYQREDSNDATWFNYSTESNSQILTGNVNNPLMHHREYLDFPVVAKRVRLYPLSMPGKPQQNKPQQNRVCLRVMLLGCPFEDAVVEYRIPASSSSARLVHPDKSYDRKCLPQLLCPQLHGGLGMLMDNQIQPNSQNATKIDERYFLKWAKPLKWRTGNVNLVLRFHEVREIQAIHFFTANMPSNNIDIFPRVVLRALLSDRCNTSVEQLNDVVEYVEDIFPDRLTRVYWISVRKWRRKNATIHAEMMRNEPLVGRYLCVDLPISHTYLLLGEIRIESVPKILTTSEEKFRLLQETPHTTSGPLSPKGDTNTQIDVSLMPPVDSSEPNHSSLESTTSSSPSPPVYRTWSSGPQLYVVIVILSAVFLLMVVLMVLFVCFSLGRQQNKMSRCWGRCCHQEHRSTAVREGRGCCSAEEEEDEDGAAAAGKMPLRRESCTSQHNVKSHHPQQWIDFIPSSATGLRHPHYCATHMQQKETGRFPPDDGSSQTGGYSALSYYTHGGLHNNPSYSTAFYPHPVGGIMHFTNGQYVLPTSYSSMNPTGLMGHSSTLGHPHPHQVVAHSGSCVSVCDSGQGDVYEQTSLTPSAMSRGQPLPASRSHHALAPLNTTPSGISMTHHNPVSTSTPSPEGGLEGGSGSAGAVSDVMLLTSSSSSCPSSCGDAYRQQNSNEVPPLPPNHPSRVHAAVRMLH